MSLNMSEITIEQPTGLGAFTIGDLGVFIGTLGGVITSILIVLQKSHCKKIKLCCLECERNDPTATDPEEGGKPTPNPPQTPRPPEPLVPEPEPEPELALAPEPEPVP